MNTKNALLAMAFSLGLAATASSQTVVRLSGSTAFRSSVHNSILAIMNGETYAYVGGTLGSAPQANFRGTIGGEDVLIKCSWSGSVGGIQALAAPATRDDYFLADTIVGTGGGQSGVTQNTTLSEESDIAMSDVYQGSTVFTTPELLDNLVAVVPFKILAGKGAPASLTNINSLQLQSLYGAGKVPLGLITGQNADRTARVYAMGRTNESGTRLTTLADCGLGALATVVQYDFTSQLTYALMGNSGYQSGGNVATALGRDSSAAVGYNIAYVGLSDAANALTAGAKELTYNGVAYSDTAVREGSYSLWGYQHLFTRDDIDGVKADVASALTANLIANPGSAGIARGTMGVSRVAEGAPIGNNYPTP